MSIQARKLATQIVIIQNPVAHGDLMDPQKTQTDLIAMLLRMAGGPGIGGLGFKPLLTSINTDHGDDTKEGLNDAQVAAGVRNHGHTNGFAVDVGAIDGTDVGNNATTLAFCLAQGQQNHWVTKIGLGGASKAFLAQLSIACPDTLFFEDNVQPHLHLQTE